MSRDLLMGGFGLLLLALLVAGFRLWRLRGELRAAEARHEAARQALLAEARSDALTGLANRRAFLEALAREMARATREKGSLSVLLLDVDHFKSINDAHGHAAGDRLLRALAAAALAAVRRMDMVARIGGEEFAILLPGATLALAMPAAERLRRALATARGSATDPTATVSVGVAAMAEGDTPDTLLDRADRALYRAKNGGRNRVIMG